MTSRTENLPDMIDAGPTALNAGDTCSSTTKSSEYSRIWNRFIQSVELALQFTWQKPQKRLWLLILNHNLE